MIRVLDEKLFPVLVALTMVAIVASLGLIFFYAPVELTMGIVQKIFYVHVPAAMAAYAGFTLASVCSFLYLVKPHRHWDMAAVSGAEVGLLFCVYVLISGPLWGLKAWGKAWVWDPQLTATFVLLLLYGSYVLLRTFSGNDERMRKIAAVLATIAFVNIPIIHYAVRIWGGLHPVVEREGGDGLSDPIKLTLSVSMAAFLLLFAVLTWLRFRVRWKEHEIDVLHLELEDIARTREAS
ncbi:MAG: cytochrome c biogenesis protein CcsA [Bradymonadaceae bacterium]|nr:cytochrome c biogenesis protein CcsA [Lujinxingiaceae bacterium]